MEKHDWILYVDDGSDGYPSGRSLESLDDFERAWHARLTDVEVVLEVSFGASYEYDDVALLRLDGAYALASTSGCSCPSPNETWDVSPTTLAEARQSIATHALYEYEGSTDAYAIERAEALAIIDALIASTP